jgi:nitroreductase
MSASRTTMNRHIDTRRDIRRYRHDDVPKELVNTVLWAGHRAPSVGHLADPLELEVEEVGTPIGGEEFSLTQSLSVGHHGSAITNATRSPTPTCGVAPVPSRICGSLPELTAWGWGG